MRIDYEWTSRQLQNNLTGVLSPAVASQVLQVMREAGSDYTDLAKAMYGDPYIVAKVIRLANLAQGRGRDPIISLTRALSVLGVTHTHLLVVSALMTGAMVYTTQAEKHRELRRWILAMGVAGNWIGRHKMICPAVKGMGEGEEFLVLSGLMRGLGVVILMAGLGMNYEAILGHPPRVLHLSSREQQSLGATHEQVTAWAMEAMRCPEELFRCVNTLQPKEQDHRCEAICGRSIEIMGAMIAGLDSGSAEAWLMDALSRLGIESVELFTEELPGLRTHLRSLAQVFEIEIGSINEPEVRNHLLMSGLVMDSVLEDSLALHAIVDRNGVGIEKPFTPITISANIEAQTQSSAPVDRWTEVLTTSGLHERLWSVSNTSAGLAGLLMIDIDYLSQVNGQYGRLTGDNMIKAVSEAMHQCGSAPLVVARIKGDEFIGIYETGTSQELEKIMGEIRKGILPRISSTVSNVSISAGGVLLPRQQLAGQWEHWIEQAGSLLNQAKRQGRNQLVMKSGEQRACA